MTTAVLLMTDCINFQDEYVFLYGKAFTLFTLYTESSAPLFLRNRPKSQALYF